MAIFRKIHTTFWSDSFVQELDNDKKLFYLYLLTNEKTKQCGIYEITKKHICYDLSMSIKTVETYLKYFISKGKIRYNESTNELAIGNWMKYNNSTSPKVQSCINKEFTYCKDTLLIEYVKSMDTLSQQEEEQEEEKEQKESCFDFESFWNMYPHKVAKQKCETKYKSITEKEREQIKLTLSKFLNYKPFESYTHPNPEAYLNQKRWQDVIPENVIKVEPAKQKVIIW